MDEEEAWRVLGLGTGDGWEAVRPAYRRLIARVHPDRAGHGTTAEAARINEAYAVLTRARRSGRTSPAGAGAAPRGPAPPPPAPSTPPAPTARPPSGSPDHSYTYDYDEDDQEVEVLFVELSVDEVFYRLLAAGAAVGDIGYVDRSSDVFEILVNHHGETCSLLVALEPRPDGTEVYIVLESLERAASLRPTPIVDRLLAHMEAAAG